MTVLFDTRADIMLDAVRRVAWGGEGVRITDAVPAGFLAGVRAVFPPPASRPPFGADIGALADAFTALATGNAGFGLPAMID